MELVIRYFDLPGRGSTLSREARGAVATFLTMAYILFVNPNILDVAGVPHNSAIVCTAAAAGVCSILMGLVANFPLALASGMGLNAFVATQVYKATGSWQAAMGLVVLDGVLMLLLVLAGAREKVLDAIPRDLRLATGAGIGLFIAFIGLGHGKLSISGIPLVTAGTLASPEAKTALLGLLITAILVVRRVPGALVIGIAASTILAFVFKVPHRPVAFAWPDFSNAFKADVRAAFKLAYAPLLISLLMVDFFDTLGTATAIAGEAGLVDAHGRIPAVRRVLIVDSIAASIGGLLGASSVTAYVESASGVAEGARTGLHSVLVGILFLICIFVAPVLAVVPDAATAPALILVGFYMITQFAHIDFANLETAIPAFLTLLAIPFTFSIAHGVGYGFIAFVAIKVASGKLRDVHPAMYVTAAAFAMYFLME